MEKIKPVLELHRHDENEDSQFYRYSVGGYRVWFSQKNDNGNIYNVSIAPQKGTTTKFELYAIDRTMNRFYPDEFTITSHCPRMTAEEAIQYIADMQRALGDLEAIKELFLSGIHFELYCTKRVEEAFARVNFGDYDLDGVEFTSDDVANVTARVMNGEEANAAVHDYLFSVREILDAGLDDIAEEL